MREVPDKSWIDIPILKRRAKGDTRYRDGWEAFLEYAYANQRKIENDLLCCPCSKCRNRGLVDRVAIRRHLERWGFDENYKYWSFHGEGEDIELDDRNIDDTHTMFNDVTTNKPSSQSVTSTRHGDTSYVVGKIGKYLMKNVKIPLALSFLPTIKHELSGAQTTWDVVQRLIDSQLLKDLLPQSIYMDIMVLAFDEHASASGGEARGGTIVGSSSTVRYFDAAATDDRDHDNRDHDYDDE
ncbi:uncharacterized protein LOC109836193 [Asparagus officinalis]|uniref:uncharacterized protein LOC109836193 n=1 Tax=Asparagus officinalis TaxID=4686 RepID=UPI00098E4173|nr:uncharacterized protein LOC109836193 [Asparagus officinalis]